MKNSLYKIFLLFTVSLIACSCGKNGDGDKSGISEGKRIVETGELAAINTRSFTAPRLQTGYYESGMKIIGILEHGAKVNAGDSIIQLDQTTVRQEIVNTETELETQTAALEKMYVDREKEVSNYEISIRAEESSFKVREIAFAASRFETKKNRKIAELEFEQSKIGMQKEKRKRELSKTISASRIKMQEIRVAQIKNKLTNANKSLEQLTIRTPISGVFQINRSYRSGTYYKIGDEVYTRTIIANVPQLDSMKVNTFISENDFLKIRMGQKVAVRLDAMPKIVFDGEVSYLGKLCHPKEQGSRQKVFDVEITMLKYDERLRPGMTVSCEFLDND